MTMEVLKDVPQGLTRERIEQQARAHGEPEWHIQRRLEAYERFLQLPLPSPKQEDWRYTDITTLHLEDYLAVAWSDAPRIDAPTRMPPCLTENPVITVFHKAGFGFEVHLPDALRAQGVQVRNLHEVLTTNPELLERDLGRLAPIPGDKFTMLHAAAWDSGLYVYIPSNVQVEGVMEVIHWFETPGLHLPHTVIVSEPGSAAHVVQSFFSPEDASVFVLGAVEVFNKPNSELRHTLLQRMGRESTFISSVDYQQQRDSRVLSLNVGLGAKLGRTVLQHLMTEPGAEARPLGLFFGDDTQHLDFRTLQDHRVGHTHSDLLYKGALYDKAVSVFSGMIRVHPKAQHTDAYQANRNLLLSEDAQAYTIPNLEIGANEVRCTHGATVGPIQPEEVFYLRSRGIDTPAAEALVIMGFFEVVLREITPNDLRLSIQKLLAQKLKGEAPRYFMDLAELDEATAQRA
ncbi:MAG: Fe-S cluster assembly protein SufD [Fimbriimonadales bacterium]|nr:MAG: Fe-S cluster assembly protein SufD [Fimbriimonadales bacterium]